MKFDSYFLMKEKDVLEYCLNKFEYFKNIEDLECKEIGDGNLNFIFRVRNKKTQQSIIIKHSSENTRARSGRKLNKNRNILEYNILEYYNTTCPEFAPKIYFYDEVMSCYAMEDLKEYKIMRTELLKYKLFPLFAEQITTFIINTFLPTTDFIMNNKDKKELQKKHINPYLCAITEQLVFTDPFGNFNNENKITSGLESFVEENFYRNENLKLEVAKLKFIFMNNSEALIHGDLHTGSIFIKKDSMKIIDPEFSFYGPIGYDLGNIIANLLFAWGNAYYLNENGDNNKFLSYIEKTIQDIVKLFKEKFLIKLNMSTNDILAKTNGFKEWYLENILEFTSGIVGLELIRRIIGCAKVADITQINNIEKRKLLEKLLLISAKQFILNCKDYKKGENFFETIKNIKIN